MKHTTLWLLLGLSFSVQADSGENDWRKHGSDSEKLGNVVKVIPGASNIMLQMGERYKNLYWAGKQGKWLFAEYQVEEMQELMKTLIITRPGRATTARDFLQSGFTKLDPAITTQNEAGFLRAFEHMRQQCMVCHQRNDHAFVTLPPVPGRGQSPVLDQD